MTSKMSSIQEEREAERLKLRFENEKKKEELLTVLNSMVKACEPITYEDFNKFYPQIGDNLLEAEGKEKRIGVACRRCPATLKQTDPNNLGISTMSIIATITDVLCDQRLAVVLVGEDNKITGFQFYKPSQEGDPVDGVEK